MMESSGQLGGETSKEAAAPGKGAFTDGQLAAIGAVVQGLLDKAFAKGQPQSSRESGGTRRRPSTNTDSSGPSGHDGLGAARLDIATLGATVQRLLQAGLAPATQRAYLAVKKKYLCFCHETSTPHLPVTESKLVNFVAYATSQVLNHKQLSATSQQSATSR